MQRQQVGTGAWPCSAAQWALGSGL
ncbi:hypothetical protein Zm00014a_008133 [Zea mays]|uniref:Uncharacterized protein n=1 Tax=Zea mays TaxID=4577 RepID=A0A3L6G4N2_MAIZE|nr:hypothetical protein Zm00014a_008133 [Zea mays]